jgi:hypothetical protein
VSPCPSEERQRDESAVSRGRVRGGSMLSSNRVRRAAVVCLITTAVAVTSPLVARARGPLGRPGDAPDCEQARCAVADQIAEVCPCESAVGHLSHVKCVSHAARALIVGKELPAACKWAVVQCAVRSTCGTVDRAACRLIGPSGAPRCRIVRSTIICESRGGTSDSGSCCGECSSTTSTTNVPTTSTTISTTTTTGAITTSTTSTTTTSSTTSSTLLPCNGTFPICSGSCPPGQQCTATMLGQLCACAPIGP